ncbi:NADPH-dependent glutamate synthase beta subunit-like oxidoreductase [Anaerobacterium chartisolvens]|uniref:NADPH-dependent glutamate synthase beta subunit-like oxidoreductase n=1 Tax=Anaerobacterium chartisolvens TaxID=1297424 RepID=A0A369AL80_9FIRM|nr:FAD-dependent oxidoreductase [Anaerobacterium chartisolvens]RCX09931.1 NADPH-dependent glutamate synthase beta subunit-like oxidoreductase [Anaerobacterium chartisolvens]
MATITIDGIRLEVQDNKSVLDCALEAGIYIPHLCHHPDLSEHGSCRLCIVDVEGEENVVASCILRAKEGLNIRTNSERIGKLRNLALELLLAGHPEDCSTCPKYGNCELQTLIQYMGATNSRMRARIKGFKSEERNPLFIHDMNRCVLCGRCVRACGELREVSVLQYNKKELETYVGTVHDKLLKDADCRFCGACAEVCPTGTIRDKTQLLSSSSSKEEALVPCRAQCPAHTDVPRYIRYVKEGKFSEAAAVIREKAPFPMVLGYICNHLCELHCRRKEVNDALSIRNIKRYAAENDYGKIWNEKGKQLPSTGKKVAVVGAGPAGLTAAYYLRKQGHEVTIKEALPKAGGMLQYGIPSYRLPREVVEKETSVIFDTGVKLETDAKVGKPEELLKEGYDAVLVAIGTHKGVKLPLEGNELPGVIINTDFLRAASMGKETGIGKKVVVLGGGNVAFDCARTAKRLGAEEVHLACLEAREKMLSDREEIHQGEEEGVKLHSGRAFEKITGTDRVTGVTFSEIESFTFDENRRAIIAKKENSEYTVEADTVIFAVGQRPDILETAGIELGRGNTVAVGEGNLATKVSGIFAAGDVVYGTNSVIKAIASGRDAASEIDKFLGGDGDISEVLAPKEAPNSCIGKIEGFGYKQRKESKVAEASDRLNSFSLINFGICDEDICGESERCLQCDLRLQISPPRLWGDYSSEDKGAE